jgi:peptide chain release factor 2
MRGRPAGRDHRRNHRDRDNDSRGQPDQERSAPARRLPVDRSRLRHTSSSLIGVRREATRVLPVPPADPREELKQLDATLSSIEQVLDVPKLRREVAELEAQAAAPDLWNDPDAAQRVTSKLSHAQGDVRRVEGLRQRLDDAGVLLDLAASEDDPGVHAEVLAEIVSLTKAIGELEVRTLLSGEYDSREALVTINSQAGGVDAADWAEMLLRMYLRWAERHNYPTEVYDTSYAEEAGIKSATFAVKVPYAYGTLSPEHGTHRLVRISPFDNQGRRQTSFAGVDVVPVVESSDHVEIPDDDIRVDVYRSSGPGGQGVNTTDSAVRITHLPTGIVVSCQNERSQIQNRASAMAVLQAKLLERRRQEQQATMDALKDGGNSWGNQMRSYVLHPYQMVKDLRTGYEVGNPQAVLDGDIDGFIEAAIRWRRSS